MAGGMTVGRAMLAPLLVLNLIMYIVVIGFASWNLNHFINGQTNYPGVAGNGATFYFLVFAILAGITMLQVQVPASTSPRPGSN
jgi:hypothetical protein